MTAKRRFIKQLCIDHPNSITAILKMLCYIKRKNSYIFKEIFDGESFAYLFVCIWFQSIECRIGNTFYLRKLVCPKIVNTNIMFEQLAEYVMRNPLESFIPSDAASTVSFADAWFNLTGEHAILNRDRVDFSILSGNEEIMEVFMFRSYLNDESMVTGYFLELLIMVAKSVKEITDPDNPFRIFYVKFDEDYLYKKGNKELIKMAKEKGFIL